VSDEARGDQWGLGSSFHRHGAAYLKERLVIFKEERVGGRARVTIDEEHSTLQQFEARRTHKLEAKRDLRRYGRPSTSNFQCHSDLPPDVSLTYWISLLAHNKSHS